MKDADEILFSPYTDANLLNLDQWMIAKYVDKTHFKLNKIIGVGDHGIIWLVERRAIERWEGEKNGELSMIRDKDGNLQSEKYVMKLQNKHRLYQMWAIESAKAELQNLSVLMHPFILDCRFGFQDSENLYQVSEYLRGGDLRYHLNKASLNFTEK